jgi:hypothetical protein
MPVVIILPGTLAIDFLVHAHAILASINPMTTLWTGTLDTGPLLVASVFELLRENKAAVSPVTFPSFPYLSDGLIHGLCEPSN